MIVKEMLYEHSPIFYKVYGHGEPVVLLHGFGEDGTVWDCLAPELAKQYRVLVPDIPGSGASPVWMNTNITLSHFADALHAILTAEKIAHCCLIGHSMGGYIGLAFAEKFSHQLRGLGLFHSSAYADDENKKQTRLKGMEFMKANGAQAFLKTSIPGLFADAEKSKSDIQLLINKASNFSVTALLQYYQAMIGRPDRTSLLKAATYPVLFIAGSHDKAVPYQHSLMQAQQPAIAHIHILQHSGHMGMMEEKEKSLEAIAYFLQSVHVLVQ